MYNYSGGQRLLSVSAYGGNNIYEDTPSFDNFSSVKGSVTIANTRPQFVNFNDKVIATNEGSALIVKKAVQEILLLSQQLAELFLQGD